MSGVDLKDFPFIEMDHMTRETHFRPPTDLTKRAERFVDCWKHEDSLHAVAVEIIEDLLKELRRFILISGKNINP